MIAIAVAVQRMNGLIHSAEVMAVMGYVHVLSMVLSLYAAEQRCVTTLPIVRATLT